MDHLTQHAASYRVGLLERENVTDWSVREPSSLWKSLWRKTVAFRTISKITRVVSQDEFCRRIVEAQQKAHRAGGRARTAGLWTMEKLSFALATGQATHWGLDDPRLPPVVQPIAHSGMGIGAMYRNGLNPSALTRFIEAHAHPDYRMCAYESLGTGWAALSTSWFRHYFRLISGTHFSRNALPDPFEFLGQFPVPIQNAIAHGFGRGLYFKSLSMQAAFNASRRMTCYHAANLIRGMMFAYVMVNHQDFPQSLDLGRDCAVDETLAQETRLGVRSALLFWEWTYPGFLAACTAENDYQQQQIDDARRVADPKQLNMSFILS